MARFQLAGLQGPRLVRFRRLLVLLLVLFQAATVITILVLSRLGSQAAMVEQARHVLANATSEAVEHTSTYLDSAQRTIAATASMFASDVLHAGDHDKLERYFVSLLEHNDAFAGMYMGTLDGEFLYVSRDHDDTLPYRVKHIDKTQPGARIWHTGARRQRSDARHDRDDNFDPRMRPWFNAAIARDGAVWTEPYVFFTARKMGITAATPIRNAGGQVVGTLGLDVELEALASFLTHLDISDSGSAFIANADGVLIAAPFMGEPAKLASAGLSRRELITVESLTDIAGQRALQTVRESQSARGDGSMPRFRIGGRDYLVDYLPLTLADGREWVVGTFAPQAEFLQTMRAHERNNLFIALAVLAASMLIGWLLAGTVWTPVAALHDQANRDALTRVFNRRYLNRHAPALFEKAEYDGTDIAAAIIDIDHFKRVNDSYGHDVGDEVIRETARRLRSAARIGDIVARVGGEEFLLLLPTANAATAAGIIERIAQWFRDKPIATAAGDLRVTFSAGIAELAHDRCDFDAVRSAADRALYAAKRSGRNRVVIAAAEPQIKRPRASEAEVDIAIDSDATAAT